MAVHLWVRGPANWGQDDRQRAGGGFRRELGKVRDTGTLPPGVPKIIVGVLPIAGWRLLRQGW